MKRSMIRLNHLIVFLALGTGVLLAQQPIVSPRDSVELTLKGKKLFIEYGSPAKRGRPIMGEFVPYNRVWRTGAGKATTFVTGADLRLGDQEIPSGTYTIYTMPSPSQWKLIINKQTGQWGTVYNPDLDLARIKLNQRRISSPVENLTINFERKTTRSGVLRIEWELTSLWIPFDVLEDAFVASPRDSAAIALSGGRISVNYGRPFRRGRKIEGGVVPYNEVWRTGANEATTFSTEMNLSILGYEIPRGVYSLYTIPSTKEWKLIINKQTGQSGTQYDRVQDLARIDLRKKSLKSPVEQFTIQLEKTSATAGEMRLLWEYFMIRVPFRISQGQQNGSGGNQ